MSRVSKVIKEGPVNKGTMVAVPEVVNLCCGQLCDRRERDAEVKRLGVAEFLNYVHKNTILTKATKHILVTMYECYWISSSHKLNK